MSIILIFKEVVALLLVLLDLNQTSSSCQLAIVVVLLAMQSNLWMKHETINMLLVLSPYWPFPTPFPTSPSQFGLATAENHKMQKGRHTL